MKIIICLYVKYVRFGVFEVVLCLVFVLVNSVVLGEFCFFGFGILVSSLSFGMY